MIKVSVIVPIFNAEKFLVQCLNSIINQTLKEIEIILINDGSTDGSSGICMEYSSKDDRIRYFYKENEGLAAARQDGIEYSRGEYIGFVDSDDWLELNMYEKMYESAKSNDSDIVFCNCYENEEKKNPQYLRAGPYNRQQIEKEIFPHLLIGIDDKGQRSVTRWSNCLRIYKKTLIDNNIAFDRRFRRCQDLQFTFETTIHAQNYYYLGDDYLYHNRQDPDSLSRGYTKKMWSLIKPLVERLYYDVQNYKEYDFTFLTDITAFFFVIDSLLNEFKPNSPNFVRKIKHIKEIISDPISINSISKIDYKRLNRFYKNFYRNISRGNATLLVLEYYYDNSQLKRRVVGPFLNWLTEAKLYKKIRNI